MMIIIAFYFYILFVRCLVLNQQFLNIGFFVVLNL